MENKGGARAAEFSYHREYGRLVWDSTQLAPLKMRASATSSKVWGRADLGDRLPKRSQGYEHKNHEGILWTILFPSQDLFFCTTFASKDATNPLWRSLEGPSVMVANTRFISFMPKQATTFSRDLGMESKQKGQRNIWWMEGSIIDRAETYPSLELTPA